MVTQYNYHYIHIYVTTDGLLKSLNDRSIDRGLPLPPHKGGHTSIARFPGPSIYNAIKCRFNYIGSVPLRGGKRLEIGKEALKMLFSQ